MDLVVKMVEEERKMYDSCPEKELQVLYNIDVDTGTH